MAEITVSIKGIDEELFRQAKAQAALQGIKIGEWINLVIKEKLERVK